MAIYLGIDGGGTKTTCAVGDETRVLATATAGGSNVVRSGEVHARESLHAAVRQACATAQVDPSSIARVCVGAAGAARPEVAALVRRLIAEVTPGVVTVVGDMEIALQAASGGGPGVIVIAGTGSIAYGRGQDGTTVRAGGWGYAISDEGSGQWIGRTAVTAALRARDEERPSALLEAIGKTWNTESVDALVRVANGSPAPNFAELFAVVLRAAEAKDEVALRVLHRAGAELAELACIVLRRMFTAVEGVPLAMSGGVFRASSLVREVFYNSVRAQWPRVDLKTSVVEPVDGALAMARVSR